MSHIVDVLWRARSTRKYGRGRFDGGRNRLLVDVATQLVVGSTNGRRIVRFSAR